MDFEMKAISQQILHDWPEAIGRQCVRGTVHFRRDIEPVGAHPARRINDLIALNSVRKLHQEAHRNAMDVETTALWPELRSWLVCHVSPDRRNFHFQRARLS